MPSTAPISIALAFEPFAHRLAVAPHCFGLLAHPALRRLLIGPPALQLAESTFPLHLLLQDAQCCIDVIVANENFHLASQLSPQGGALSFKHMAFARTPSGAIRDA